MNYFKLDGNKFSLEGMEKLALNGNVEAATRVGRYYGKKAKINAEYYEKSISFFLLGANVGCKDCMINVSKNALKYGKYLTANKLEGDYRMYFRLALDYAFKAFSNSSIRTQKHLVRSLTAIKKYDVKIDIIH
ncbi:MAG: hypothetical protein IJW06_01400 [Clostridia bacterium]|nr:hypothetical protein [Clostridia bacterium]